MTEITWAVWTHITQLTPLPPAQPWTLNSVLGSMKWLGEIAHRTLLLHKHKSRGINFRQFLFGTPWGVNTPLGGGGTSPKLYNVVQVRMKVWLLRATTNTDPCGIPQNSKMWWRQLSRCFRLDKSIREIVQLHFIPSCAKPVSWKCLAGEISEGDGSGQII